MANSKFVPFILVPTEHMHRATEIRGGKDIQVSVNNRVACGVVPEGYSGEGYEDLVLFMKHHPLKDAFFKTTFMFPEMLAEFWYTCVGNREARTITGTYRGGNNTLTLTENHLRAALNLPIRDDFVGTGSKTAARQSFPLVGQPLVDSSVKIKMFSPRWSFLLSNITRSLSFKCGSLTEINDFEAYLFNAIVTGKNIDFARLYFNELLVLTEKPQRDHNVPFIRVLSLMFEQAMSPILYEGLKVFGVYEYIYLPECSVRMFNRHITDQEVPLTPAMMHWVNLGRADQPAEPAGESSADSEQSGSAGDQNNGQNQSLESEQSVSAPTNSPTHVPQTEQAEDMDEFNPTHSNPSSHAATEQISTSNNLMNSPVHTENTTIIANLDDLASVDSHQTSTRQDVISAAPSSLLELVGSGTLAQPEPARLENLDTHITVADETHSVNLNEEVPILDSTNQIQQPQQMAKPTLSTDLSLSLPSKNVPFLHILAQAANVTLQSQGVIQASNPSMSDDRLSLQQEGCEDMQTIPTSIGTSQTEASVNLVGLNQALTILTQKFDDKLSDVQSQLNNFNNNFVSKNELMEVRRMVGDGQGMASSSVDSRLKELEKKMDGVDEVRSCFTGFSSDIADLKSQQAEIWKFITSLPLDDVKKGEKRKRADDDTGDDAGGDEGDAGGNAGVEGELMQTNVNVIGDAVVNAAVIEGEQHVMGEDVVARDVSICANVDARVGADVVGSSSGAGVVVATKSSGADNDLITKLSKRFRFRRYDGDIVKVEMERSELEGVILLLTMTHMPERRLRVKMNQIIRLGFCEWRGIAFGLKDCVGDQAVLSEVFKRVSMLIHVVFEEGFIGAKDYEVFCEAFNQKKRERRMRGHVEKYDVPEHLEFVNDKYVEYLDGLMFKAGKQEMLMRSDQFEGADIELLINLLTRCESEQALPFRKRLLEHLYSKLSMLKKIKHMKNKCKLIEQEYRRVVA